ncbi:MAG: zinc ribbon domain-containing protein [Tissierellia bacterium]|nr:zinc ribbon domain-containing protein [Tissierellia bacterium]
MFFIFGISDREKLIKSQNMYTHNRCGRWGRVDIYMVETVLSLFFIPTFRWNKRFFAHFNCCNRNIEIDKDIGMEILRNPNRNLNSNDLKDDKYYASFESSNLNYCQNCGKKLEDDFEFCPYCGHMR